MSSGHKSREGGNKYYFGGGRGGSGGQSRNGSGGAGGQGMGASLSLDIQTRQLNLNNNLHIDNRNENSSDTAANRHPTAVDRPYIQQNIHNHGNRGIDVLHRVVALEAIHDSAESCPQPRCHPETRTKILQDLRDWVLDPHPQNTILWFNGPAGAGKSAIMQTLAGELRDAGRLGGSFFFKRGHATRGNGKTLFSTIAYQLALSVPWLRTSISQIVEDDPSVVARSLETQMRKLISKPSRSHQNRDPVAILIDGLDECEGHSIQEDILRAIRKSSKHAIPLRFIVASRPEPHIRETFHSPSYSGRYRSLNVEQSFHDVRKYLRDGFSRIHRGHHTMKKVPSPWPAVDILENLVKRSSGYFIYAATIIKFIDDKNYRPTQRLAVVHDGNKAASGSAFDALDQLYMAILGSTPRQAELIPILCAIANFDLTVAEIDQLFELPDGETQLVLRGLHSVLQVPSDDKGVVQSHHASLWDFLDNRSRSHNFYVGALDYRLEVARGFLSLYARGYRKKWFDPPRPRSPRNHLISFIVSWPPSVQLCPHIARMNPDYIFDLSGLERMVTWLKKLLSAPEDLVERWEDYVYMSSFDRGSCSVKQILWPSSELCQVLVASAVTFLNYKLRNVRHILDITWNELRDIVCRVRPSIGSSEPFIFGSTDQVLHALVPPETLRLTCRDIAVKCIRRIIKGYAVAGDGLDVREWFLLTTLLTFCPPCSILYDEFQCIPRGVMKSQLSERRFVIQRIFNWLKSFRDPTLELVAFWRQEILPNAARGPLSAIPNASASPHRHPDGEGIETEARRV